MPGGPKLAITLALVGMIVGAAPVLASSKSGGLQPITGYTGTFDEVLVAREPALWGTAGDYHFVYHAFVGLTPNTPPTAPYESADPVVSGTCSSSFVSPAALQEMARRTGGLRYPLCDFANFDAVFKRLERLESEYASLSAAVRRLEERVTAVEQKLDRMALRSELVELKDRAAELERRIAELEKQIN